MATHNGAGLCALLRFHPINKEVTRMIPLLRSVEPLGQEKPMQEYLDYRHSLLVAICTGAVPNHCYQNAWRALITLPEIFRPGGKLIEGWFVVELEDQVIMNEHGWCELDDGTMIDPSLPLLLPPDARVSYFPGVLHTWEEAEAFEGQMFPRVRFAGAYGADGLGHPGYKAAHDAAKRKVAALAQRTQPAKRQMFLTARGPGDDELGRARRITVMMIITPDRGGDI